MPYPFELKKVYNFDVYPASILGNAFQNVTIMAILDYQTAIATAFDADALHVNVFPLLPSGTPDDPTMYDYVKIKMASGSNTILGIPWINLDTLVLVESRIATVTVEGVAASDVDRIRTALNQNGFNNISIKLN